MKIIFVVLGILFSNTWVQATSKNQRSLGNDCVEYRAIEKGVQFGRQDFQPLCYLSIHPVYTTDLVYRDYLFTNTGELMVFNSYGDGPDSESTGARVYYFFPRTKVPHAYIRGSEIVAETATPGLEFVFDSANQNLKSVSLGKVYEEIKVHPGNKGGIEIQELAVLWLDSGFKMGSDPTQDMTRNSVFRDHKNNSCTVKNKEIFAMISGSLEFKHSDLDLKKFLAKRCSNLEILY
jgi:hypothetical protein